MAIQVYPSDLSNEEWLLLAPLLPPAKSGGRPRSIDLRRILNGLFYLVRSGCAWRYLPREYGPWSTVYHYFRVWRSNGSWEQVHAQLRTLTRERAGRSPTPSAAIIDSQSIRTHQGGPRGFDGGKKVFGRKRHLLVDTLGLLLKVVVHPASLHDRKGAKLVLGAGNRLSAAATRLGGSRLCWGLAPVDARTGRPDVGGRLSLVAAAQALFSRLPRRFRLPTRL
jgi:putative transposase